MTDRLSFRCDVCTRPVAGGEGFVTVDVRQAYRYIEVWIRPPYLGDRLLNGAQRAEMSKVKRARWRVLHTECDREAVANGYSFEVERTDSVEELADWSEHIAHRKNWAVGTDWATFVFRVWAQQVEVSRATT